MIFIENFDHSPFFLASLLRHALFEGLCSKWTLYFSSRHAIAGREKLA